MIKQRGVTVVEFSLVTLGTILLMVIFIPFLTSELNDFRDKTQLQSFVAEVFVAAEINYFNEVNSHGRCYTFAPSALLAYNLVTIGMLERKWIKPSFIDASKASITYSSKANSGRVDTIDVEIPYLSQSSQSFYQLPYYLRGDANAVVFRKKINYNQSERMMAQLDSNFCFR